MNIRKLVSMIKRLSISCNNEANVQKLLKACVSMEIRFWIFDLTMQVYIDVGNISVVTWAL